MEPLYTLLLCLPAALALIACACGIAVVWPPATRPANHPTVGRRCGERKAARGAEEEVPLQVAPWTIGTG
jgi:hypothetical protein